MFRPCLACALVCAAFLDGACAVNKFRPWEQDAFFFGLCHTEHTGYRTRKVLEVPTTAIPADQKTYELLIPDLCKRLGLELVGVGVTICDADAQPVLTLTSVTRASVRRRSKPTSAAKCYINEYCK